MTSKSDPYERDNAEYRRIIRRFLFNNGANIAAIDAEAKAAQRRVIESCDNANKRENLANAAINRTYLMAAKKYGFTGWRKPKESKPKTQNDKAERKPPAPPAPKPPPRQGGSEYLNFLGLK